MCSVGGARRTGLKTTPLEDAQNMNSVWTAWFQFWRKQRQNLRNDVLFLNSTG